MRSSHSRWIALIAVSVVLGAVAAWQFGPIAAGRLWAQTAADHDDHDGGAESHEADEDGHDHGAEKHEANEDGHGHGAEEPEAGHAGHGDEDDRGALKLTGEQMRKYGISLATARAGRLHERIRLPGEIVIDADRAAHIVPQAGGIVREVMAKVGDKVKAGDVLAVLESAALSEARTQYLARVSELSRRSIDLARAEAIEASMKKLLALLDESPTLDQLRTLKLTDVGEGYGTLVSAYAELVFAEQAYDREKKLLGQKLSSKGDFQTAASAYKKAYAQYLAARGAQTFATRRTLLEARRLRRTGELAVEAAEQKLHVLGLIDTDVAALKKMLLPAETGTSAAEAGRAAAKARERETGDHDHGGLRGRLGRYSVRAPFDGTVIQKHITLGEKLAGDADVFTLADLSSVWVNLSVYQKDLATIRAGQPVHVVAGPGIPEAEGVLSFVSPIVNADTRTCLARVDLANPDGSLRPGLFVTAEVAVGGRDAAVLVPKAAVQRIEGEPVVFVAADHGLESRPVKLGASSGSHVQISSGLKPGERYVATGAFALKSKIVTSGMDAHAGHGH